jgi:HEAT repeat protein
MKRDRTQQRLDQLRTASLRPDTEASITILREALTQDTSNYVTAKAAAIIESALIRDLTPELLAAFDRLFTDPKGKDRGCEALTAIAKALYAIDYQEPAPYLRGIRHTQMEGFGGNTDVATGLRGVCALALAQTRYERTLEELVLLLTDRYPQPRWSAARALGCTGLDAVIPLLMFKVLTGDEEPQVLAECMIAMLALSVGRTLPFVIEQLDSSDADRAECAAIALGSVRDEKAFTALREKWDSTAFGPIRERILHAMSASRTDTAIEFLLNLLAREPARTATLAANALALHKRDERICRLVHEAVNKRAAADLPKSVLSSFGSTGTV